MRKITAIIFILVIAFSCQKYSDGPELSLYTRKYRIVNNWRLKKIENSTTGVAWDTSLSLTVWGFDKVGTFWKSDNTTGFWEFIGKDGLKLTLDNGNPKIDSSIVYTIAYLGKKDLRLVESIANIAQYKYYYEPVE